MSRKQNWYIGRYVRAVSGFLPCSGKVKKPLLDALRAQAEEYIEGGGDGRGAGAALRHAPAGGRRVGG